MTETIIRRAMLEDVAEMVELGKEMHQESSYKNYSFSERKVTELIVNLIEDRNGIPLVAVRNGKVVGGILGFVTVHYFGNDKVASDLALFVAPEERKGRLALKIIKAFINEANDLGAKHISLGNSTGVEAERVKSIYERMGFQHVGFVFHMKGGI